MDHYAFDPDDYEHLSMGMEWANYNEPCFFCGEPLRWLRRTANRSPMCSSCFSWYLRRNEEIMDRFYSTPPLRDYQEIENLSGAWDDDVSSDSDSVVSWETTDSVLSSRLTVPPSSPSSSNPTP